MTLQRPSINLLCISQLGKSFSQRTALPRKKHLVHLARLEVHICLVYLSRMIANHYPPIPFALSCFFLPRSQTPDGPPKWRDNTKRSLHTAFENAGDEGSSSKVREFVPSHNILAPCLSRTSPFFRRQESKFRERGVASPLFLWFF